MIHGGESFVALSEALQNALALCGGVPAEHRTDSLSACFRNRDGSYAGDYTSRYRELCAHLGVIATRNNRGVAHENGAIEGPHRHWKHRLEQQLIQRGSRDFSTEADYRQLVAQVTATLNSRYQVQGNLEIERLHLQPLPVERFADYEPLMARVRSTSTIEVRSVTYSVPSRLIGQQLTVHLRHDRLDLFLRSQFVETLPRLHRQAGQIGPLRRIDFRHVIESLGANHERCCAPSCSPTCSQERTGGSYGANSWRPCRRMRPPRSWSMPSMSPPNRATWPMWSAICGVSCAAVS